MPCDNLFDWFWRPVMFFFLLDIQRIINGSQLGQWNLGIFWGDNGSWKVHQTLGLFCFSKKRVITLFFMILSNFLRVQSIFCSIVMTQVWQGWTLTHHWVTWLWLTGSWWVKGLWETSILGTTAASVRATLLNIPKQALCGLYKKVRVRWDEIDGMIMIRYDQEW